LDQADSSNVPLPGTEGNMLGHINSDLFKNQDSVQDAAIDRQEGIVEDTADDEATVGDVATEVTDSAVVHDSGDVPAVTAATPETAALVDVAAVDNSSFQITPERQQFNDNTTLRLPPAPLPSPTPSLGPAAGTRSRSRTPIPEGTTLGIPVLPPVRSRSRTPSRSVSPLPGDKRKAEVDGDDGNAPKKC
jgi:hypothetical protein